MITLEKHTVKHVIETMGGGRVLAAKLGISESNCSQWISNGYIPPGRSFEILQLSRKLGLGLELFKFPMERNNGPS